MKPFSFILASAFALAAIHAYAGAANAGPQGAGTGFGQNSVQDPNARFRLDDGEDNNLNCANGIGHMGECIDIDFYTFNAGDPARQRRRPPTKNLPPH